MAYRRRERVIAVSIRKDIDKGFAFPQPIPLETKFRDLLEEKADEQFYLTQEIYEWYQKHSEECKEKGWGFRFNPIERERAEIATTITTNPGRMEMNHVIEV